MRRKNNTPRPLLEEAEGRDADRRSDLLASFHIVKRWIRWASSNLNVREFLLLVNAMDRSGNGVELTYDEIADRLEMRPRGVKKVIDRAEEQFRLLEVIEQDRAPGGRRPHRYRIDRDMVRAIMRNEVTQQTFRDRPTQSRTSIYASEYHGVRDRVSRDTRSRRSYKEKTRIPPDLSQKNTSPSSPPTATLTPEVASCSTPEATWEEVAEVLSELLADWKVALKNARENKATPGYVLALIEYYNAHSDEFNSVGVLYHRIRNARLSVAPDEGWPASRKTSSAPLPAQTGAIRGDKTTQTECIRAEVVRKGRQAGKTDAEIDAAIERRLKHEGLL